jgi:hypothetical protein
MSCGLLHSVSLKADTNISEYHVVSILNVAACASEMLVSDYKTVLCHCADDRTPWITFHGEGTRKYELQCSRLFLQLDLVYSGYKNHIRVLVIFVLVFGIRDSLVSIVTSYGLD